jgi:hypothetical protein
MIKKRFLLAKVCALCATLCDPAASAQDGSEIARRFQTLHRDTAWNLVDSIPLGFDTHHPQGMAINGNRVYLSSVRAIDRHAGTGEGYLFECGMDGQLLRTLRVEDGPMYHPGGIDLHSGRIWLAVAEYRPDSRSRIGWVDLASWTYTHAFDMPDHLGGIVHDAAHNRLVGNSWGSRRFYVWNMITADDTGMPLLSEPTILPNPTHFIDFQDAQWLPGTSRILASGLISLRHPERGSVPIGGMALIDSGNASILHEIPVPLWTQRGRPMTQNPSYVTLSEFGLRFHFIPDDNDSTLYVYEVETEPRE